MNLQGWRFHVVGGDAAIQEMMEGALAVPSSLKDADIVMFSGGADISVSLYGESTMHNRTQFPDRERDKIEEAVFHAAVSKKKTVVGICRGAQLLNVLNGGKLYQHVDKHTGRQHFITYTDDKGAQFKVLTTSDHHQMMIPESKTSRVLGFTQCSVIRCTGTTETIARPDDVDPEIVWYPKTKSLCYQPHPEWKLASDRNLFIDCVKRVMIG